MCSPWLLLHNHIDRLFNLQKSAGQSNVVKQVLGLHRIVLAMQARAGTAHPFQLTSHFHYPGPLSCPVLWAHLTSCLRHCETAGGVIPNSAANGLELDSILRQSFLHGMVYLLRKRVLTRERTP